MELSGESGLLWSKTQIKRFKKYFVVLYMQFVTVLILFLSIILLT